MQVGGGGYSACACHEVGGGGGGNIKACVKNFTFVGVCCFQTFQVPEHEWMTMLVRGSATSLALRPSGLLEEPESSCWN